MALLSSVQIPLTFQLANYRMLMIPVYLRKWFLFWSRLFTESQLHFYAFKTGYQATYLISGEISESDYCRYFFNHNNFS